VVAEYDGRKRFTAAFKADVIMICPLRMDHMIQRMRSGCKRIVNGILWEMSELITQQRIAVRIFKLEGWIDHVTCHV